MFSIPDTFFFLWECFTFSLCFVHTSLKMFMKNSAAENTSAAKFLLPLALVHRGRNHSINSLS